jgi:hypothetical protein
MNDQAGKAGAAGGGNPAAGREEMQAALFGQLVMQQSSMAFMLLGKAPHPETGKIVRDLDTARLFIEQLEMLETKTRGNLTKQEAAVLKQTLMTLRLAFVEAADELPPPASGPESKTAPKP